jgi:hypothetical protein
MKLIGNPQGQSNLIQLRNIWIEELRAIASPVLRILDLEKVSLLPKVLCEGWPILGYRGISDMNFRGLAPATSEASSERIPGVIV